MRTIVYIDESGFAHDMPRTHGYVLAGKRCFGTHNWQARGRTNAIGALESDSSGLNRLGIPKGLVF